MSDTLTTHTVAQIAIVVRDIESTAKAWADLLGVDAPPWHMTDPREESNACYRGEPTDARAKLAFFHMDNLSIELIEPVGGPSTWQEFLDAHGDGVHHIAFRVEDMDGHVAMFEAKGMTLQQSGDYTGGCYSYMDSTGKLGTIVELLAKR